MSPEKGSQTIFIKGEYGTNATSTLEDPITVPRQKFYKKLWQSEISKSLQTASKKLKSFPDKARESMATIGNSNLQKRETRGNKPIDNFLSHGNNSKGAIVAKLAHFRRKLLARARGERNP